MKHKQFVVTLLKYGLGVVLLAWVIWRYWEPSDGTPGLRHAANKALTEGVNWVALALAAIIYLIAILITFYRWYVLVRAQELPFTVAGAMRLGMIGFYLSTFLPGSVGGDIIKAAFIAREQSRRTVAVATVMVDRFIGLCGLFWLVALVGSVAWYTGFIRYVTADAAGAAFLETIVLFGMGVVVGTFAVWFVAGFVSDAWSDRFARGLERIPKLGTLLAELWRALHMYRQRGKVIALTLAMSVVGHIGFVLSFYFAALTLSSPDTVPSLVEHFLLVPVGMTITSAVPTPGGVGGAEIAFGKLYDMVRYPTANGVLGSLVWRVATWALGLMGYLVYLRMKPALKPVEATVAAETA